MHTRMLLRPWAFAVRASQCYFRLSSDSCSADTRILPLLVWTAKSTSGMRSSSNFKSLVHLDFTQGSPHPLTAQLTSTRGMSMVTLRAVPPFSQDGVTHMQWHAKEPLLYSASLDKTVRFVCFSFVLVASPSPRAGFGMAGAVN